MTDINKATSKVCPKGHRIASTRTTCRTCEPTFDELLIMALEELVADSGETRFGTTEAPKIAYDQAIAKIKALVVESLPKEHECTKDCNINSNEWRRGHLAYKDGLKAGLGEIRSIYGK